MIWAEVEDQWTQLEHRARRHWSRLTRSDVAEIAGSREALIERLQERYQFSRGDAEREAEAWAFCLRQPQIA